MPIIKSAKKRVRIAKKATVRNVKTKRGIKIALKALQSKASDINYRKAQSALDKAGKKNVMHKNKVARRQRQLAKLAKAAGVKNTSSTAPKKTVAKKPVRQAQGKPATKKTTAKK